jgi:2-(1,2-epoxy-1,2-dihydrophenyl)acetyl-CoA isomerase
MSGATVLVEPQGAVLRLTLNRPDKLNSFTEAMHGELRAALDGPAATRDVRAVLLTGAGRAFSAGQDLGDRVMGEADEPPDLGDTLARLYNPLVRRIRALPKPVVCAVNGIAAGAGASIALACDLVLAARSASFIQAFCKIGLVPDSGGTWMLPRLVGEARAKGLAFLGERLSAEQAQAWGLIWAMVDDDRLADEAVALARRLAEGPTLGLAAIKRAIHAAATSTLDAQLELERDLQRALGRSHDYAEGVRAFMEKRPARFRGA